MNKPAVKKIQTLLKIEDFSLDPNVSAVGTYFLGSIRVPFSTLVKAFGEPKKSDGYKVSGEWVFLSGSGKVFTLYDWKETNLYDSSLPSVYSFRKNPYPVSFNIGGNCEPKDLKKFIDWLNQKIDEAS